MVFHRAGTDLRVSSAPTGYGQNMGRRLEAPTKSMVDSVVRHLVSPATRDVRRRDVPGARCARRFHRAAEARRCRLGDGWWSAWALKSLSARSVRLCPAG